MLSYRFDWGDIMTRFKLWKDWSKHSLNHPVYKFLVLLGLAHSPTFDQYVFIKEQMVNHPELVIKFKDETPNEEQSKEESKINWGWYTVYLLMIVCHSVMSTLHDFDLFTWQHWAYFWMLVLCFIAGSEYRKE